MAAQPERTAPSRVAAPAGGHLTSGADPAPDAPVTLGSGAALSVEYCGEWYRVGWGEVFDVGRDADLTIDDNPALHRRFLRLSADAGLWWLENTGSRLSATVRDVGGGVQAWLPPHARLPLVFPVSTVTFLAGPTSYELDLYLEAPPYRETRTAADGDAASVSGARWTTSQLQLVVALAEPLLRRAGSGLSEIPSSAAAARRLGWTLTRFNRKLDNVCDKLDRHGVKGLRGGPGSHATSRRIRLVEFAVTSRFVTPAHLALLEPEGDERRLVGQTGVWRDVRRAARTGT